MMDVILDFGFSIFDFANPKSKTENRESRCHSMRLGY
jgi:hypothetical protein